MDSSQGTPAPAVADLPNMPGTPARLLAVHSHQGTGYSPLVDYGAWRVALLNYDSTLEVQAVDKMQRHNETDEVFVLLKGRCLLFLGDGAEQVERIYAEDLRPCLLYNVRRGVWHNHSLSKDAQVLVVENRDTTYDNSPFTSLTTAQQGELVRLCALAWGGQATAPAHGK